MRSSQPSCVASVVNEHFGAQGLKEGQLDVADGAQEVQLVCQERVVPRTVLVLEKGFQEAELAATKETFGGDMANLPLANCTL
jgi:hypothetical protein